MCGRIIQASGPLDYQLVDGLDVPDSRLSNIPRRFNAAPGQELLVIRQNHATGERSLDLLRWGLIPSWIDNPKGGPKSINAMAETVRSRPMFRDAYRKRRCIVPVDGFFEWQATRGGKQPYAIGMKTGMAFGLAGLWENWKDQATGEWVRTFTVITVPSNELIARIHDRMPAILRPLLISFPAEPMKMWPISKRVNSPRNDDEGLLTEIDLAMGS
jgi:putative SOS response-associated peptidase YedK